MKQLRRSVDAAMMLLIITLMGYNLTGNAVHEWGGVALFILFLLHIWLNRQWWTRIFKGKYRSHRIATTTLNLALLLVIIGTIVAALPISGTVLPTFPLWREAMWPMQWHVAAANWMLVLSALHAGAYWGRIRPRWSWLSRTWWEWTWRMLSLLIAGYALWVVWSRNVAQKMVFYYTFDFSRGEESFDSFFRDYIALFLGLVILSYHFFRFIQKRWK